MSFWPAAILQAQVPSIHARLLQVTGNTNAFCSIGDVSGKGSGNGKQPPYNLQLTTTSSFQPSSLTPFTREVGAGRKLLQQQTSEPPMFLLQEQHQLPLWEGGILIATI